MKQKLFLLAASTLALAACTQVEDVPEVTNAIGFENVVSKPSRAVTGDLTQNNFDMFSVYGYYTQEGKEANPVEVFNNVPVTKSVTDGVTSWNYDNTRYWNPDATYFFYAYSCADVALDETGKFGSALLDLKGQNDVAGRALEIQSYLCNHEHQHDLIVAKNEGMIGQEKSSNGVSINRRVGFRFEHALSKINAVFTSKFPVGYDMVISDVKIVNYYDKGDFDFATMTWGNRTMTQGETSTSIALAIPNGGNITSQAKDPAETTSVTTNPVFMLPMKYNEDDSNNKTAAVELQFTIDLQQNGTSFLSRNLKAVWQPNWQKGTAYTYYVDLGGDEAQLEAIVFESTQDMADPGTWGEAQRVEMTFSLQ